MNRLVALAASIALLASPAILGQDVMQFGLKQLRVLAENDKVRVLQYTPKPGDKTPMHSHQSTIVYVVKGGRVKYTLPDGSTAVSQLKTGEALLRPPVTHSDQALDEIEVILIELKQ